MIIWNGVNWNGVNWNGVSWNGVSWNGVSWNGVNWNGVNWQGDEWSIPDQGSLPLHDQPIPRTAPNWSGLGWFVHGIRTEDHAREGAFVVTNPSVRAWIYEAPTAPARADRLHFLGKLVEGSACLDWPVIFGEVDGQMIDWRGVACLAPSMWSMGPQVTEEKRLLSAFMIALFNTSSVQVSLRAPVPGLASTEAERSEFPTPQACYAGDLFRAEPIVRAYAIHDAGAAEADFAGRGCRISVAALRGLPAVSLAGEQSFLVDPCSIEWTDARQEIPLAGYETGDDGATLTHCEPTGDSGEVTTCRMFAFEHRTHPTLGSIQVATAVDDYPTVCAYLQ